MMKKAIEIQIAGPFRISDDRGKDLTPNSSKAAAVLALLATSPSFSRSRLWLQSKLWSDRAGPQASGSLRHALSVIRHSLGRYSRALQTEGCNLKLDPDMVGISMRNPSPSDLQKSDLLEGLEQVRDAEFENWLRDIRQRYHSIEPERNFSEEGRSTPTVIISVNGGSGGVSCPLAYNFANSLATHAKDYLDLEVIIAGIDEAPSSRVLELRVDEYSLIGKTHLCVQIVKSSRNSILWGKSIELKNTGACLSRGERVSKLASVVFEKITEFICNDSALQEGQELSSSLIAMAVSAMSDFSKDGFCRSDRLLRRASEISSSASPIALRALLRNLAVFQFQHLDFLEESIETTVLCDAALQMSTTNSIALMVASQIEYVDVGNLRKAQLLANEAVENNEKNSLAWCLKSNVDVVLGCNHDGYRAAARAIDLSAGSRWRHVPEFFACMAATSKEEYELAMMHALQAASLQPSFAAPARYRTALSCVLGDEDEKRKAIEALRVIEPDFNLNMMSCDKYPITTMRSMPIYRQIC